MAGEVKMLKSHICLQAHQLGLTHQRKMLSLDLWGKHYSYATEAQTASTFFFCHRRFSFPVYVKYHCTALTQALEQKHYAWLCIILPSIKIAFKTANTAPTSILLWAAAKRWRSQEERIPGNNFPMERRVNLLENGYALPSKISFVQNPFHPKQL